VCSFGRKPAFIVITGDLTNWGGSWISGAMNCLAFASCLYKKAGQFYADANYSVPVYTTPGNHEYIYTRNLMNYHRYIETDDRFIVNYSDASLFFLNSGPMSFNDGAGLYDSDMKWLEGALDNCTAHIKIVLMHHPAVNARNEHGRMSSVIARNREAFVTSCENHNVELVLTGHTHQARIFDGNENAYEDPTSLNCSLYPTLFVQTDDCDKDIHYRNVTFIGNDVWLERCVKVT
jgi:3',5'-cyclic AMP phosphodiesterase CpdA